MKVPLLDLTRQYQSIKGEINHVIKEVLESQHFILGENVEKFEKNVADYCRVKHAIGVASGTDALLLSLRALGIGHGDRVITTPFTFFATAGAIHNVGAQPVFADIEPDTYNIDPEKVDHILRKDSSGVKAIIPVHIYGQMAEMDYIMEISEKYNLAVVEDAAQAIGAEYKGKKAGNFGSTGCFSFFPSKNLGGAGDGGMIVTNDDKLAEKLRILRVHGSKPKYYHHLVGYNSRLDALQAAILNVKLSYLDKWSNQRAKNAKYYNKRLYDIDGLTSPSIAAHRTHIFNQYTIRIKNRDGLKEFLTNNGIGTEIYYPIPVHLQPCFKNMGYKVGDFPMAERASKEVLSLPIFPELTEKEKNFVIGKIREFLNQ